MICCPRKVSRLTSVAVRALRSVLNLVTCSRGTRFGTGRGRLSSSMPSIATTKPLTGLCWLLRSNSFDLSESWALRYVESKDCLTRPAYHMGGWRVGAGNSAVVVDLPRWGLMLSPRVPIPGPRMERETPGQRPRPNYGHPQAFTDTDAGSDKLAKMPEANTLDTIIAGSWYLPASSEHRVGGKLYVHSDGTTVLEVAGKLDASPGAWIQDGSEELIYGIGTDGTLYSLFDSKLSSSRLGSPPDDKSGEFPDWSEYSQYVWHVSYYTHGPDFIDDKSEISDVHVSLSVLQEWMAEDDQLESVGPGASAVAADYPAGA